MDLSKRKYNIIEKIIALDENGVSTLEDMLMQVVRKSKRPSVTDYNNDLKEANKRLDKADFYTQEEVLKMTESW